MFSEDSITVSNIYKKTAKLFLSNLYFDNWTELLENALKDWLPPQEKFDSFAREAKGSPKESGRAYFDTTDAAAKSKQR